jgi:hypothetical protein
MGTDFKYQYAESWFRQMDKLIHYVNKVKAEFVMENLTIYVFSSLSIVTLFPEEAISPASASLMHSGFLL